MSAGNIQAIGDWAERYFYTKDSINDMFIKCSIGLKTYLLTLIGSANSEYTLVETAQTDPQTYTIETDSNGRFTGILFFHDNAVFTIGATSYTPSDYVDVIYIAPDIYIPYSDTSKILCSINSTNYDWKQNTKGVLELSDDVTYDSTELARFIPVATDSLLAKIDLGGNLEPFTAYVVMKGVNVGAYGRLLSSTGNRSASNSIMLYGSTLTVSQWGDIGGSTGINSQNYFAAALKFASAGSSAGLAYPNINIARTSAQHGKYLVFGATDENFSSPTNLEKRDVYVRYIGVVKEAETDSVILNNLNNLYSELIGD